MRNLGQMILLFLLSIQCYADFIPCGGSDPDCKKRLHRILDGTHFAETDIESGIRFGEGEMEGAIRFHVSAIRMDTDQGNFKLLPFEALYLPGAGGVRIRFSLSDADVLFFCTDNETGEVIPPLSGIFRKCRMDGWLGLGGEFFGTQWDGGTQRLSERWTEMNFVFNFLRNGNNPEYLNKRLEGFLGASLETVWAHQMLSRAETMARGNLGLIGFLRTDDYRWEVSGYAGFRPNIIVWDDWSIEARAQVLYHLLLHRNVTGDIGVRTEFSHWQVPWHSIGTFSSDTQRDSAFLGLVFGVTFE